MSKPTIRELAKELGIAVSTVSKALRDSHEISADTKAKVLEYAARINYVPNPYASSLRRQKSKTIAVVLPEVADSFFSLAINGIESVAKEKGYHVLIYLTHESHQREIEILNEFKSGRVDGLLISVAKETKDGNHISDAMNEGLPVVFFDRKCPDVNTAKVVTDDFESSFKATKHLIEKGCRHIAYLSISPNLSITKKREEGFLTALKEAGIDSSEKDIIVCDESDESNYSLVKDLLNQKRRPDGIIASVEKLVPLVYLACKELDLNIPNNIKLTGFTNLQTSLLLNPPLTTVTQPAFEMGKTAATLLFKGIEKPNFDLSKERVVIPSSLQIRESTG
jgi:LacI family transcriptional regulator